MWVSADMLNSALSLLVCSDLVSDRVTGLYFTLNECKRAGPSALTCTLSLLATIMLADDSERWRNAAASGMMCTLHPESTAMLDHRQPAGACAGGGLTACRAALPQCKAVVGAASWQGTQ